MNKFLSYFCKSHYGIFRIHQFSKVAFVAAAVLTVIVVTGADAQCPGGAEPDALGCRTMPDPSEMLKTSPASISIEETNPAPLTMGSPVDKIQGASGSGEGQRIKEGERRSTPAKPEPLTEFQKFVAASTGATLSVYGANLFSSIPASFAPIDVGPVPKELIVDTDDELRIRVWGQVNLSENVRVSREGEIYIPKVGAVHVAGLPFSAVQGHLRSVMERVYRNFELSVDFGEIHSIQVYVTGHVHRPGEYTVSALSTLVDAVFASGGPSASGSMRHVQLKRVGKVITDFDLYTLLIEGNKTGDVPLQAGDVLFIPATGPQVALLGSVREAGIYEFRGQETIGDLIEGAGGRASMASGGQFSIERIENHSRRRAFNLASDAAGLQTLLVDGDIVRIDPILSSFTETVTLRGGVANPGHFRWHTGMRLSEIVPDRDSLEQRDYWWHRTRLGLPSPELAPPAGVMAPGAGDRPAAIESPSAQTNWNFAVIERLTPTTMKTSLIPFNLGKLVLDHDMTQDQELTPGDVITIFTQSDIQIPLAERTKYVSLEGEFNHPGIYSASPDETLKAVVDRAGGLTPQAYIYAASFTRKSTRALEQRQLSEFADQLQHQLLRNSIKTIGIVNSASSRQALAINDEMIARIRGSQASGRIVLRTNLNDRGHIELPDLHLEDGDRLVVPFKPETVQVLGSVFNPQAFLFQSGLKAGQFLRLAGGPNRDADRKRVFVLRADGTVSSTHSASSLFTGGLDQIQIHPGDSIVVPEKTLRLSTMAEVLAWTSSLSQMSLPALEAVSLAR